jgi:hypothetical protein
MLKSALLASVLALVASSARAQTSYLSGSFFGGPAGSIITCTTRGNVTCCGMTGGGVAASRPTCRKIATPRPIPTKPVHAPVVR